MWLTRLPRAHIPAVAALVAHAEQADGVAPLNEAAHLALTDDSAHHLLYERDGRLLGYLQWQPGPGSAQLVVAPDARRQGIGTALADALREFASERIWAFGDTQAAQRFAAGRGLVKVRELELLERPLTRTPASPAQPSEDAASPPASLHVRTFRPDDADDLLAVNAAAFAHHPEQGALDRAGLAARMAEPWFDPDGLFLGFDDEGLAGFHWTKTHDQATGEVYVIGVAPQAQGRGYGRTLLDAGLRHLAAAGQVRAILYVDRADSVALEMYVSAGFTQASRDVLYEPHRGGHQ